MSDTTPKNIYEKINEVVEIDQMVDDICLVKYDPHGCKSYVEQLKLKLQALKLKTLQNRKSITDNITFPEIKDVVTNNPSRVMTVLAYAATYQSSDLIKALQDYYTEVIAS